MLEPGDARTFYGGERVNCYLMFSDSKIGLIVWRMLCCPILMNGFSTL